MDLPSSRNCNNLIARAFIYYLCLLFRHNGRKGGKRGFFVSCFSCIFVFLFPSPVIEPWQRSTTGHKLGLARSSSLDRITSFKASSSLDGPHMWSAIVEASDRGRHQWRKKEKKRKKLFKQSIFLNYKNYSRHQFLAKIGKLLKGLKYN